MTTEQFRVPGVACQHCVRAITDEVSTMEGVQRVLVSIDDKTVTVEHTDQVSSDAVIAAINEAGYDDVARL